MFLVSYFVSSEEKQHLLKKFRALDLFGDGKISKKELVKRNLLFEIFFPINFSVVYQQVMKSSNPEAEADEVLKHVDNSGSGSINYTGIFFFSLKKMSHWPKSFSLQQLKEKIFWREVDSNQLSDS